MITIKQKEIFTRLQGHPRPAPQGRPPSISFGAPIPGMQQMHGMPAHNNAGAPGVPIHMPHSGPGQQQPTAPRGQLPPQVPSTSNACPTIRMGMSFDHGVLFLHHGVFFLHQGVTFLHYGVLFLHCGRVNRQGRNAVRERYTGTLCLFK